VYRLPFLIRTGNGSLKSTCWLDQRVMLLQANARRKAEIPPKEMQSKVAALIAAAAALRADEIVLAAGDPGEWQVCLATSRATSVGTLG